MTIDQRLTAVRETPNKSPRQNVPRRGAVLHHAAMTSFDGLRNLAMGAKQVSATNIVKDEQNEWLVPEGYRPWSLSSAWGDSSFRSMESANESTNGWTMSDESHWTMARNVAYWSELDDWWPHRDGDPRTWTVITHGEMYTIHGESYATACAGGTDPWLVTRRAQQLRLEGDDMPLTDQDIDRIGFNVWQRAYPNLDGGATVPVIEFIRQLDAKVATQSEVLDRLKALLLDETTNIGGGKARVIDMWKMTDHRVEQLANADSGMSDAQVKALAEQLRKQGIVATLDKATLAAIGQAARASIVKD